MWRNFDFRIVSGVLLILGGAIFLLENLRIIQLSGLFWGLVFGIAGIAVTSIYFGNRANWWAWIPGLILLDLAVVILMEYFFPDLAGTIGGPLFLVGISAGFFVVYAVNPQNWWAIIPAGIMLTLAAISGLEGVLASRGMEAGGGLFIGIGLTFLLLYILPARTERHTWAIFPAGIMLVMGVLVLASAAELINYVWPVALILIGGAILLRQLIKRS